MAQLYASLNGRVVDALIANAGRGLGKSLLDQSLVDIRHCCGSWHAARFIFDETKSALVTRSRSIGLDIREGDGPGEIAIRQIDPVEVSTGEFAAIVRKAVEEDGARVVIIDSLNGYLNAMPQNNFMIAQLHELLSYLSKRGEVARRLREGGSAARIVALTGYGQPQDVDRARQAGFDSHLVKPVELPALLVELGAGRTP